MRLFIDFADIDQIINGGRTKGSEAVTETSDTLIKPIGEGRMDASKVLGPHFHGKWPQRVICTFEGNHIDQMVYVPEDEHDSHVCRLEGEVRDLTAIALDMFRLLKRKGLTGYELYQITDALDDLMIDWEEMCE